jgi:prepilin-type N-terminal cleavage/methylation domain-containing protein
LQSQLQNKIETTTAFTLVEVLVSMMIVGIIITGLIAGFTQAEKQAEWSAYNLAAQSLAMQPLEQARGAKWDPYANPPVDQITNIPSKVTNILDIPITGTNIVYATNRITISTVSTTPPLKKISVECTWRFFTRGVFTNTVVTYRAPDQ